MKIIYTSKGQEILVDDMDYQLLSQYKWSIDTNGYARTTIYTEGKVYKNRRKPLKIVKMHRLVTGYKGKLDIDHIDRNKLNNQKDNLRVVTRSENAMNRDKNINNTSGYKGIHYHKQGNIKKRWFAKLGKISLGYFASLEEALIAREVAEGGKAY